ncbi:hypothetical protein GCM10010492_34250 [Saccharothrix mutabilis subsp. mutabilis]|uniref:HTH marR-type domain-containing protein n=2 Tax=Saccharothrix mutabilis TaxID=33921 RepID=A0ABN0TXG4_9PSEU
MVGHMRPAEPPTDHAGATASQASGGSWTFLSNHAHVLLCLAADPHQTLPVIAEKVGITTRAVQLILTDLIQGGYIERTKVGRRNHYRINPDGHLRHPLEAHHRIADLITAVGPATPDGSARDAAGDGASTPPRRRRTG